MSRKRDYPKKVVNKLRLPKVLKTKKRQKEIRLRKNFLPTLFVIFVLWTGLVSTILFVNPNTEGSIIFFFILFFLALLFTFATLFANTRRGLLASGALTLYILLAYLGVASLFNLVIILAIAVVAEIYFIKA